MFLPFHEDQAALHPYSGSVFYLCSSIVYWLLIFLLEISFDSQPEMCSTDFCEKKASNIKQICKITNYVQKLGIARAVESSWYKAAFYLEDVLC